MIAELANEIWYGNSFAARIARVLLLPAARVFEVAATRRARAYDRGDRQQVESAIPVVSVGNLTVGGTGKTPFAGMLVRTLREMGRAPAIVMRGYGGDEPVLHEWLNPGVRVYTTPDRAEGIARATADGADVAVLDDAFQHRRAARDLDIVLVSVDRWRDGMHLLPAGPLREPIAALRRASVVALTLKSASRGEIAHVREQIGRAAPGIPTIVVELTPDTLRPAVGKGPGAATRPALPLGELGAADVFAIAGIGDPASFFAQLERAGARVTRATFADHHAYTDSDVDALVRQAAGHKYVVTTAKDAVKLGPRWPANAPALWYVSQAVAVSDGASLLDAALRRALSRRSPQTATHGHRSPPINS
jgi:tetraacyldisaccharide 4'-kinase